MLKTLTKTTNTMWMLAVSFLIFSMTCCSVAQAQIQPTYIRPSKGKVIEALTRITSTASSAVYDWSAFDGAFILVSVNGPCTFNVLTEGFTSSNAAPASVAAINDPNAGISDTLMGNRLTYYVSIPAPYVRFTVTIGAGLCPDGLSLVISPVPLAQRLGVSGLWPDSKSFLNTNNNFYPVIVGGVQRAGIANLVRAANIGLSGGFFTSTLPGLTGGDSTSTVVGASVTIINGSGDSNMCYRKVINTDTSIAYCGTTNTVTSSTGYPLSAAAGPGQAGGSLEFNNYSGGVYCITSAGTTTVRTLSYRCSQ